MVSRNRPIVVEGDRGNLVPHDFVEPTVEQLRQGHSVIRCRHAIFELAGHVSELRERLSFCTTADRLPSQHSSLVVAKRDCTDPASIRSALVDASFSIHTTRHSSQPISESEWRERFTGVRPRCYIRCYIAAQSDSYWLFGSQWGARPLAEVRRGVT
jgi:hypothetical protein